MNKYIDAEKLIAEIERLKDGIGIGLCEYDAGEEDGKMEILIELSSFITSLQQEQPIRKPHNGSWIEETKKELQHEEELLDMRLETLKRIRDKKNQFQQEQLETPSGEEVMTMCNQILIDWVKEGKTPEEREQREQAHIRFFELYDEYMERPEVALEKGETINTEILLGENGKPYIHSFEVYDYNKNIPLFLPGTEVTLQIRKVEQNG